MSVSVVLRLILSFVVLCSSFSFSFVYGGDLNTLTGSVSDATLKLAVNSLSSGSLPTRADAIGLTIDVAQKFFGFNLFGSDASAPAVTYAQVQELLRQLQTDIQNNANANLLFSEYLDIYSEQQQAAALFANNGGCINQLREIDKTDIDDYRRDWKNGGTLKDQFDFYCWTPIHTHSDLSGLTLKPLFKLEALQAQETWNGRQVATRRALDALVLSIQLIINLKNQAIKIQSLLNPDYNANAFATSKADLASFYSIGQNNLISMYIRMRNSLIERRLSLMGETFDRYWPRKVCCGNDVMFPTEGPHCVEYHDYGQLPSTSGAVVLAPTLPDKSMLCHGAQDSHGWAATWYQDSSCLWIKDFYDIRNDQEACMNQYKHSIQQEIKSYITSIDEAVCGLVTAQTGDDACWMTSDNPKTAFAAQLPIAEFYSEPNFSGRKRIVRESDLKFQKLWNNHRTGIAFRYDSRLNDNRNFPYQDCDAQTAFYNQHNSIQGLPFIPKSVKMLHDNYQYMAYGKLNDNMHNCGSVENVVGSSWGDYRVLSSSGNFRDEWSSAGLPAHAVHMIAPANQGQFKICNKKTKSCLGAQPHMGFVPNQHEWPNSVSGPDFFGLWFYSGYWFSASPTTKDALGWYFNIRADNSLSMRDATHTKVNQLLGIRVDGNMLLLNQNLDANDVTLSPIWQVFPNEWGLGNVLYRPAPTGDRYGAGSYALGADQSNGHIQLSDYYTARSAGNGLYEIVCGAGFILDIHWPTLCRPPSQQASMTNIQDGTEDIHAPIGAIGAARKSKVNILIILAIVIPITVLLLVITIRWYVVRARARARATNSSSKLDIANTNNNTNNTNSALALGVTHIAIDDEHHHVNI